MSAFNLRLKPFDVIILIIAVITMLALIGKGIAYQCMDCYGYAIITGTIAVIYVKRSDIVG